MGGDSLESKYYAGYFNNSIQYRALHLSAEHEDEPVIQRVFQYICVSEKASGKLCSSGVFGCVLIRVCPVIQFLM